MAHSHSIVEPFKVKMVERLYETTKEERVKLLEDVGYNVFLLQSKDVYIDLLSDSGTGAMSQDQWSALLKGDESYAGDHGFTQMKEAIQDILGFDHVIPCHQGRAAENILHSAVIKPGMVIPGDMHFDTTKAHIENNAGIALGLIDESTMDLESEDPFKGNIDIEKLRVCLENYGKKIPFVVVTVTCNSAGGQPVSLSNMKQVKQVCEEFDTLLCADRARFFENAYLIKERERDMNDLSVKEIVKMQAECFDLMTMSAKEDAIVNIGGFLAMRDKTLYMKIIPFCVLYEGFVTYGGMSGRDMECLAVGLHEGMDEEYLKYRIGQVKWLGERLRNLGIPIMWPTGGHAIYIDMKKVLPHVDQDEYPGIAFCIQFYIESGVRGGEVGTLLNGRDPQTGENKKGMFEFVRLAIPRRVYTFSHLEYVAKAIEGVWKKRNEIRGVALTNETPILRHFTSSFELL